MVHLPGLRATQFVAIMPTLKNIHHGVVWIIRCTGSMIWQSMIIQYRYWQPIAVNWMPEMRDKSLTEGCILSDYVHSQRFISFSYSVENILPTIHQYSLHSICLWNPSTVNFPLKWDWKATQDVSWLLVYTELKGFHKLCVTCHWLDNSNDAVRLF